MRLPVVAFLLMVNGGARFVEAATSLNLFRPDTGQRTTFEVRDVSGRSVLDTVRYSITALSADTAYYRVLYFRSQTTGIQTLVWSQGRLTARALLKAGTLDTNGIYSRLKTFPADFTSRTATNPARSGYTLQHVVNGFLFDTLLVACHYNAALDEGDNCDFVTPAGVLVYSNVVDCLCSPSSFRVTPDAATLAAMGGKPVSNGVAGNPRHPAVSAFRGAGGFDILGRWRRAVRAVVFPASPAR